MSNDVRGVLTGAMLRTAAGIRDVGETIFAYVEALTGPGGTVTNIDTSVDDVHVHTKDVLTGQPIVARLFAAAGILWRLPLDGDSVMVLRPGNGDGPGVPLALHGDGGKNPNLPNAGPRVPPWLSSALSGILLPEGFQLESTGDKVVLKSNTGSAHSGKPASVTLAQDGSVTVKASDGQSSQVTIALDANGGCTVTGASGQNVVVNVSGGGTVQLGGTTPIARQGDHVTAGTSMATWMQQVETTINTLVTTVGAGSPVAPLSATFNTTSTTGLGPIAQGSSTAKSG